MLTPGLSKRAVNQQAGSLTSVFTRFGGGKHRLAARKMRVLDDRKLGRLHPEALKDFSQNIPAKFREVKNLIRFTPGSFREASIWSEIDRTLPNQAGFSPEIPPQPGELRPGSIIQKIPMTPRPEQSIESFREGTQQFQPTPARQKPLQKPSLDPRSRLFSRVQEITGQDQPPEVSAPESTEAELKPSVTTIKPATLQGAKVQRQAGSPPIPEAQAPEPVSGHRDKITETPVVKPEIPTEGGEIETSLTVEPLITTEAPKPAGGPGAQGAVPTPAKPGLKLAKAAPQAVPVHRALPKARPVPRIETAQPAVRPLPAAAPLVQRKPAAPAAPEPGTPQEKTSLPSQKMETGLQDETETTAPPESRVKPVLGHLPEQAVPTVPETAPAVAKEIPATFPPTPTREPGQIPTAFEDPTQVPLEMPLLKTIKSRQQTARVIKALEPETLTPRRIPPIPPKSDRSLDPVAKYQVKRVRVGKPPGRVSPHLGFVAPAPVPVADIFPRPGSEDAPTVQRKDLIFGPQEIPPPLTEPLSMLLDYTRQVDRPSLQPPRPPSRIPVETRPQISQPQPEIGPEAQTLPAPASKTSGESIAQRMPDAPSEISTGETVRRVEDIDEPEEGGEPGSPDLDKLAEDVLPLVKRILEIEAERLSNNFR